MKCVVFSPISMSYNEGKQNGRWIIVLDGKGCLIGKNKLP